MANESFSVGGKDYKITVCRQYNLQNLDPSVDFKHVMSSILGQTSKGFECSTPNPAPGLPIMYGLQIELLNRFYYVPVYQDANALYLRLLPDLITSEMLRN